MESEGFELKLMEMAIGIRKDNLGIESILETYKMMHDAILDNSRAKDKEYAQIMLDEARKYLESISAVSEKKGMDVANMISSRFQELGELISEHFQPNKDAESSSGDPPQTPPEGAASTP